MLITKARNEAEEAQRLLLFALNGLGALFLLGGEDVQAIQSYREVFRVRFPSEGLRISRITAPSASRFRVGSLSQPSRGG